MAKPAAFDTLGVDASQIASARVTFSRGNSATLSWTPAEPGARIQIFLSGGSHYPLPSVSRVMAKSGQRSSHTSQKVRAPAASQARVAATACPRENPSGGGNG